MLGAEVCLLNDLFDLKGFFFSTENDFLPDVDIEEVSIFFFKLEEIVSVFFFVFIHKIIYTQSL